MTKEKNYGETSEEIPKRGEPYKYDTSFKGPIKNRSCTDIICCLLFLVFLLGMIGVGIFAYSKGDPRLLLYPTDSQGNICGIGSYATRPYLFYFDMLQCSRTGSINLHTLEIGGCPTPQICVTECPSSNFEWLSLQTEHLLGTANYSLLRCKYGFDPATSEKSVYTMIVDEDCAPYYLKSTPIAGRCIPTFINDLVDATTGFVTSGGVTFLDKYNQSVSGTKLEESTGYLATFLSFKEYGVKIYQDVRASWWLIIVGLVISMVVSFVWIILMRWVAGIMVWVTIGLFTALFVFTTYYCFNKYFELKDLPDSTGTVQFTTNLDYYLNLTYTWLALGILSLVILLIIIIVILYLRSRILIAISLIKEVSKAMGSMIFTLFWPVILWALQLILCAYWGASVIFIASMGRAKYNENTVNTSTGELESTKSPLDVCDPNLNTTAGEVCNFLYYGGDAYIIVLQVFMWCMWFWVMNFIVALGQMTLAGAFASYYFAFKKPNDIPAFPVTASLWRSLRYHIGTIAFGSFWLALLRMIRVILEFLDRKLKGSENIVARFLIKCLTCCFWLLEKCIRFINKIAYIMTGIYGYNFCKAAFTACNLIVRNIVRVAVVDRVTDFLVFVGKVLVVGAVSVFAFYFFSGDLARSIPIESISDYIRGYTPELNFYLLPVIIIGIGSYMIASGFFSVFTMGVDTLFLCFLEDLERNDGSEEKPYYMSKGLMKILGKKNETTVMKAKKE